jgi:ABC-2 type transport system permease protein
MWFLIVFIPAIAMRTVSEEIKTGTLEFLLTKPLKLRDIVLGKYVALLAYFAVFFIAMIVLYFTLTLL